MGIQTRSEFTALFGYSTLTFRNKNLLRSLRKLSMNEYMLRQSLKGLELCKSYLAKYQSQLEDKI